LQWQNNICD